MLACSKLNLKAYGCVIYKNVYTAEEILTRNNTHIYGYMKALLGAVLGGLYSIMVVGYVKSITKPSMLS